MSRHILALSIGLCLFQLSACASKKVDTKPDMNIDGVQMLGSANGQGKTPTLKPAQVKIRYVEDQIKDNIFIPAHFEYEISEPARWQEAK